MNDDDEMICGYTNQPAPYATPIGSTPVGYVPEPEPQPEPEDDE